MNKLNTMDWVALILIIIGGLNVGLVGLLKFDLISAIFGDMSTLSRIIFILFGLSSIYLLFVLAKFRRA